MSTINQTRAGTLILEQHDTTNFLLFKTVWFEYQECYLQIKQLYVTAARIQSFVSLSLCWLFGNTWTNVWTWSCNFVSTKYIVSNYSWSTYSKFVDVESSGSSLWRRFSICQVNLPTTNTLHNQQFYVLPTILSHWALFCCTYRYDFKKLGTILTR